MSFDCFTYDLPAESIAQRPVYPADEARLLVVNRSDGSVSETIFRNCVDFLKLGDRLVLNNTKVIPARLYGKVGHSGVELLLIRRKGKLLWSAIGKPGRKLQQNSVIEFDSNNAAIVENRNEQGILELRLILDDQFDEKSFLGTFGTMPIPPYIRDGKSDQKDINDYQTLFAKVEGSIAAPTASLHFTQNLLSDIERRSAISYLTLHVSTASFFPVVKGQEVSLPGHEEYECSEQTMDIIMKTRENGGRIISVGTTTTRALETIALNNQLSGNTDLFIKNNHQFKLVDCLITNFHQPGTTHLLIVEALLGRELLKKSYQYAIENKFRFLSYGDGMIII